MLKFDNVKSSNASKPHAKDAKEDDEKEEVVVVDGQTFLLLFFATSHRWVQRMEEAAGSRDGSLRL